MAVAGVLAIGHEYSTGMIMLSLTAVPRRLTWFFAKAAVLTGPALIASALAVVVHEPGRSSRFLNALSYRAGGSWSKPRSRLPSIGK